MTTTIALSNGDRLTGRTADTIIRREYGSAAFLQPSSDPNSPHLGQILEGSPYGGYMVRATVAWIEAPKWWTTVAFGGNPAPVGPWRSRDAALAAVGRWKRRAGHRAGSLVAAHTIRLHSYSTRAEAVAADISDGRSDGVIDCEGLS